MAEVKGKCYCGSVEFTAQIDKINAAGYCHCQWCRRAHAAPLYQVVYVPSTAFIITKGVEFVKKAKAPVDRPKAQLGQPSPREFCSECGTRICNRLPAGHDGSEFGTGFFPAALDEATQHALPAAIKPVFNNQTEDSVVPTELACMLTSWPRS